MIDIQYAARSLTVRGTGVQSPCIILYSIMLSEEHTVAYQLPCMESAVEHGTCVLESGVQCKYWYSMMCIVVYKVQVCIYKSQTDSKLTVGIYIHMSMSISTLFCGICALLLFKSKPSHAFFPYYNFRFVPLHLLIEYLWQ